MYQHNRRVGGIKPGKPLTCPDSWPNPWPYVPRMHAAHTRTTRRGRDLSAGLADLARTVADANAVALASALADGWQPWEICQRFGCDLCPGCIAHGCDGCDDGQAAA